MKYIYGPVKSRRLGLSLGLSLTPHKVCNLDCVYCQLGKSKQKFTERTEYVKIEEILEEFKAWIEQNPQSASELDFITFSGLGEPTLNINIGYLIGQIRKLTNAHIAVITNSTLLKDPQVRLEISTADLIVPSLDAVRQDVFEKIDRPAAGITIMEIIDGLVALRREFRGKIWLEVMLIDGINDTLPQIKELKEVIEKINPDKIQLNSPVRSTAENGIKPADKDKLEKFKDILGEKAQIV
ncbi:MAG: radical SAM protein [Candidatus Omnitrophica bacterium]|jgi:wyosine [tRNA(Phe)-imidazoG37] synthetase (radical SAM superfamily)|nr:radical SAM protein [Candidatus Omnitrophota bacterium]